MNDEFDNGSELAEKLINLATQLNAFALSENDKDTTKEIEAVTRSFFIDITDLLQMRRAGQLSQSSSTMDEFFVAEIAGVMGKPDAYVQDILDRFNLTAAEIEEMKEQGLDLTELVKSNPVFIGHAEALRKLEKTYLSGHTLSPQEPAGNGLEKFYENYEDQIIKLALELNLMAKGWKDSPKQMTDEDKISILNITVDIAKNREAISALSDVYNVLAKTYHDASQKGIIKDDRFDQDIREMFTQYFEEIGQDPGILPVLIEQHNIKMNDFQNGQKIIATSPAFAKWAESLEKFRVEYLPDYPALPQKPAQLDEPNPASSKDLYSTNDSWLDKIASRAKQEKYKEN